MTPEEAKIIVTEYLSRAQESQLFGSSNIQIAEVLRLIASQIEAGLIKGVKKLHWEGANITFEYET